MLDPLVIIFSYALLGAGMKYADQAYDVQVFNKKVANYMAILGGTLMGLLIIFDSPSATIFLAMFIGLALTQKIDNIAFYVGTGILLLLPVIFHDVLKIEWLPFGILILAGIIDEIGNDWADRRVLKRLVKHTEKNKKDQTNKKFTYKIGEKFFLNRFMMKIAVFFLVIFNFFAWLYFIAFMAFDIMYLLVEQYSFRLKTYSINKKTTTPS
jgi:hypothetical protein